MLIVFADAAGIMRLIFPRMASVKGQHSRALAGGSRKCQDFDPKKKEESKKSGNCKVCWKLDLFLLEGPSKQRTEKKIARVNVWG
jgi:hypothetical protein